MTDRGTSARGLLAAAVITGVTATLAVVPATTMPATGVPVRAAAPATAGDCRITSPPEGTGPSSQGFNTRLHSGQDTIWTRPGPRRGAGQVQPRGTVDVIMLFVDFPNRAAAGATPAMWTRTEPYYDYLVPPALDWFETTSHRRLRLDVDAPQQWYRMDHDDTWYEMGWLNPPEIQSRYIQEAVDHADDDVDFSEYDLIWLVPVRGATGIPNSPEWNDYEGRVSADGRTFYNGVTFGQDMWTWGHDGNGVPTGKLTVHETMHDFGLPDLYPPSGSNSFLPVPSAGGPLSSFPTVGGWNLMNDIRGHAPDVFAWDKWKLGWLGDNQVDCVTAPGQSTHELTALEVPGGSKAVVIRTGPYTALIAESRRAIGLDSAACDEGVLIYHVDTSVPNGDGPLRVRDAWPGSGNQSRPGLPTCRELDRGTLRIGGPGPARTTYVESGITIEVIAQGPLKDTIRVTTSD